LPPRPDDPNIKISEDPQTLAYLAQRAYNEERIEREAKLEAKRRAEELRKIEELEKRQRLDSKRHLEARQKLPLQQLEMFVSGAYYHCAGCHARLKFQAACGNEWCQHHNTINLEPLMQKLRDFARNYIANDSNNANAAAD
jgi:hypothetical protein